VERTGIVKRAKSREDRIEAMRRSLKGLAAGRAGGMTPLVHRVPDLWLSRREPLPSGLAF